MTLFADPSRPPARLACPCKLRLSSRVSDLDLVVPPKLTVAPHSVVAVDTIKPRRKVVMRRAKHLDEI